LVGRQEGHPACKKLEWWGTGMVICLERDADFHNMAQLMPLLLTVSCFSKMQIGFTYLVPAHPGSPGKRAVKRVCVCVTALAGEITAICHLNENGLFRIAANGWIGFCFHYLNCTNLTLKLYTYVVSLMIFPDS